MRRRPRVHRVLRSGAGSFAHPRRGRGGGPATGDGNRGTAGGPGERRIPASPSVPPAPKGASRQGRVAPLVVGAPARLRPPPAPASEPRPLPAAEPGHPPVRSRVGQPRAIRSCTSPGGAGSRTRAGAVPRRTAGPAPFHRDGRRAGRDAAPQGVHGVPHRLVPGGGRVRPPALPVRSVFDPVGGGSSRHTGRSARDGDHNRHGPGTRPHGRGKWRPCIPGMATRRRSLEQE